jgi:integrase
MAPGGLLVSLEVTVSVTVEDVLRYYLEVKKGRVGKVWFGICSCIVSRGCSCLGLRTAEDLTVLEAQHFAESSWTQRYQVYRALRLIFHAYRIAYKQQIIGLNPLGWSSWPYPWPERPRPSLRTLPREDVARLVNLVLEGQLELGGYQDDAPEWKIAGVAILLHLGLTRVEVARAQRNWIEKARVVVIPPEHASPRRTRKRRVQIPEELRHWAAKWPKDREYLLSGRRGRAQVHWVARKLFRTLRRTARKANS